MGTQCLLFAVLLIFVSVSNHFGNCLQRNGVVVSQTPKQLLGCMANCVDPRLSQELVKCGCNDPSGHGCKEKKCFNIILSMTRYEFLATIDCISRNGDPAAQNRLNICNQQLSPKAGSAFKMCATKIIGTSSGPALYAALAADPIRFALGTYECMSEIIVDYTPEEREVQIAYETCFRKIAPECLKTCRPCI